LKRPFSIAAWLTCFAVASLASSPTSGTPVPDGRSIKGRVLKSFRQSEDALEKYSCILHDEGDELNSDGSVKKHRSSVKEQFFVNQIEIEHTLARDGKPLSPSDARKEQERVDKQVKKFSDPKEAAKAQSHDEKQADLFLRALELKHGRREQRAGRDTLVYDLAGDPDFRPKKIEERFAQVLTGNIAVDEQSGTPVDLRFETIRDIKIGAGLLANLHKGFWLHLSQQRQPDGIWMVKQVQGSGDARAALFVRARFRFKEELESCHVFAVNTRQKLGEPGSGHTEEKH